MKLRLPHKFQAALMAAIASVSFTTLSTGTLTAAGFAFFGHCAAAADATDDSSDAATIDIGDANLDAQAAMDEEESTEDEKKPADMSSFKTNEVGFNGSQGQSSDDTSANLFLGNEGIVTGEYPVGIAEGADQGTAGSSGGSLPSDDLGFTSNPYVSGTAPNGSGSVFQVTANPATAQTTDYQTESTSQGSSSGSTSSNTASGVSVGGTGAGSSGLSVSSISGLGISNNVLQGSSFDLAVTGITLDDPEGDIPLLGALKGLDTTNLPHTNSITPSSLSSSNTTITFATDTPDHEVAATLSNYIITFQFTATSSGKDAFFRSNDNAGLCLDQEGSNMYMTKGYQGTTPVGGTLAVNTTDTFALTISAENNLAILSNLSTGASVEFSGDLTSTFGASSITSGSSLTRFFTNGAAQTFNLGQVADLTGLSAGEIKMVATTGSPVLTFLTWNGTSTNSTWSTGTTTNWKNTSGSAISYTADSNAKFDSTAAQKRVTISSTFGAGVIEVSDTYTFRFSGTSNRTLTATELHMDNGALTLESSSTNRSHKLSITRDLSGKGTVDIKANTTLAVGGNISIAAGDTLTIINENTSTAVTANGLQADGTLVKSGNGALTITGNADSFISAPISLTGGTLTLNGTYKLDGMTPTQKTESYTDGQQTGNGFKHLNATIKVVNKGSGTTLSAGSATFSYDRLTGTGLNGNGEITFDHTDYTTFYVNESGSAESLANAVNKAGSHSSTLTSIQLADGTALNVDTDATLAGTLTVDGSATLTHTGSSDNTLQVAALSLAAGDSLTLEDGVNLALSDRLVGEQHLEGLKLEEGSTLTLKLYNQWDDPQSGNNNFKNAVMREPVSCGIVDVKQGSISYYSELGTSVLHLGEGAELQFADNPAGTHHTGQDHALFENDIVLDGDAAVATHGTTKHIDCTVSGDIYGEDYTLTHTHDGNLLLDFTGTVILGEYYNNDTRNEYGYQQNSRFSGEFKIGTVTTVRSDDDISHTEFCGHGEVGTIRGAGYVHLTDYTPNDGDQSTLTIIGTVKGTGADAFTGTFRQGAGGLIIADGANVDFSNVDYLQQNDYPERKFDGYLEVEKNGILTLGSGTILGDITTAGTLTFAKTLDLSADVVTQTDGVINVNSGATVTFKEGTLTSAIQNSGTVNLDEEGSMDVSALPLEGGGKRVYYNTEGDETTRKSYFLGVTKGYVTVVDNSGGGSYNTGAMASFYGATYALQNQGGNGIIPFDDQIFYETYYHGENEKITVSEIKSGIPGTTTEELQRVVLTDGELDVNSNVPTVDSSNATVSLNGGTITDLNVQGATTVNGELSKDTNLNIDHAQVATLTDGLTRDGVTFSHGAQITNTAHDRTTYSLGNEDARVTADSITAKNNSDVTIGNLLDVPTVTNEGPSKLTISNGDDRLKEINATGGDIEFQNMGSDTVALDNVSIGTGNTLKILEDLAEAASVSVSDTLTVGSGAAMKADVTMKDRSTLDVSASGGTNGLNLLESSLTLESGVSLSAADMATIENMSPNSNYDLAYGVSSLYLGANPWSEPIKASDLFANFPTTGDPDTEWYVYYSGTEGGGKGGNVGAIYIYKAPEPATSTLSLLALAALAARRRRRK